MVQLTVDSIGPDDWARFVPIRLAALLDTPDAFGSTYAEERDQPESRWREWLGMTRTLVARIAEQDVGITMVAPDKGPEPGDALIWSVWVAPAGRGAGVGDALMRAAIRAGRAAGSARLVLEVGDHNTHAIALYARHGFVRTGNLSALPPPREQITEHERALVL